MAEGLLKKRLKELGKTGITVRSAGVRAIDGYPPMSETIDAMKAQGVDLAGFKSTSITDELIREADLILAMTRAHKDEITQRVPEAASKTFLLREYGRAEGGAEPDDPDVPDPIGLPFSGYKVCIDIIKEEIERVAKIL
jgi:protein-tyrosine-phosphatase